MASQQDRMNSKPSQSSVSEHLSATQNQNRAFDNKTEQSPVFLFTLVCHVRLHFRGTNLLLRSLSNSVKDSRSNGSASLPSTCFLEHNWTGVYSDSNRKFEVVDLSFVVVLRLACVFYKVEVPGSNPLCVYFFFRQFRQFRQSSPAKTNSQQSK